MLTKSLQSKPGEYLRFVWKVYRPLFCSTAALEKSITEQLWGNGNFIVVGVSGGYAVDAKSERDYETWEAIVRVNRAAPAPTYQAILAGLESFNGSMSCSAGFLQDAFQMVDSQQIANGTPNDSAAQTIADRTTQASEAERAKEGATLDNAISAIKTTGGAVILVALAFITAKLTGILK